MAEPVIFALELICDETTAFPVTVNVEPSKVKLPSPIIESESDQVTSSLFAPDPSVSTKFGQVPSS